MPNYKDINNNLHSIEKEYEHLLPSGCVEITDSEEEAIRQSKIILPTYQQLRAVEYPPMADYLDAIVKSDEGQKQTYIDACLAVKAKYPKV
jgi:hypothetical protein